MGSEDYDSTGKTRPQDSRSRSGALVMALIVGVCLGVMFSERVYLHYQVSDECRDNNCGKVCSASAWCFSSDKQVTASIRILVFNSLSLEISLSTQIYPNYQQSC